MLRARSAGERTCLQTQALTYLFLIAFLRTPDLLQACDYLAYSHNTLTIAAQSTTHRKTAMAPPRCLCLAVFGTVTALRVHTMQHGHSLQCGCGDFFANQDALDVHQEDTRDACEPSSVKHLTIDGGRAWRKGRFYCRVCTMDFGNVDVRDKHLTVYHYACPTCLQIFKDSAARKVHQKDTGHCYCTECSEDDYVSEGKPFSSLRELARHTCAGVRLANVLSLSDSYECATCEAVYEDALDFVYHVQLQKHLIKNVAEEQEVAAAALQLARVEESNLWCEQCTMRFVTVKGFTSHKRSSKHKAPLVAIKCSCGKEFGLVSGFLAHLESSSCDSGMTRKKLNALVYRYDSGRCITSPEYAGRVHDSLITESSRASIMPSDSASIQELSLESLSLDSSCEHDARRRVYTPEDSDTKSMASTQGGVILTPDSSDHASTNDGSIATPSTSDTASTVSGGSVILTPSASTRSTFSDDGMHTPSGSTGESGTMVASFSSTSSFDMLTPSTMSLDHETTPAGSSNSDGSGEYEWYFLNSSRMLTPAAASIDGSSVSTIRFDAVSKVWPCSKCDRTFPAEYNLRQHMNSAVHGPKIFHCPPGSPDATPAHQQDRTFKSASALVQHIENESCNGGIEALKTIVEVLGKPMQKKLNASITSLQK